MRDGNVRLLMREKAYRERPVVSVGADLAVAAAEHVRGEELALCLQPRTVGAEVGWLGLYPEATHVAYLAAPAERLEAGERLSVVAVETALAEASAYGDDEIVVDDASGFMAGAVVEVADASRYVTEVEGTRLMLTAGLGRAYSEGTTVRRMRQYLVLGSEDDGGQGHHLRVAAREVGG